MKCQRIPTNTNTETVEIATLESRLVDMDKSGYQLEVDQGEMDRHWNTIAAFSSDSPPSDPPPPPPPHTHTHTPGH